MLAAIGGNANNRFLLANGFLVGKSADRPTHP